MVKCRDIQQLLPSYLDDFLKPGEKKNIDDHLSSCGTCSRELADLKKALQMLHEVDEVDTPPWFKQQIMAKVRQEAVAKKESFFKKLFFPLHIKIPVQALATVLVAVLAVYIYKSSVPDATRVEPTGVTDNKVEQPAGKEYPATVEQEKGKETPEPSAPGEEDTMVAGKSAKQGSVNLSDKAVSLREKQERAVAGDVVSRRTVKAEQENTKDQGIIRPRLPGETAQQTTAATAPVIPETAKPVSIPQITLTPDDATAASREIEALLSGAGARIINRQLSDVSETIKLEISAGNLISLVVKLKKLGKVKSKDMPSSISPEEKIIIHLEIAENIR